MIWLSENFPISEELAQKLNEYEEKTGNSSSDLITKLLEEYFQLES